ncbi:MAG: hypothetical protein WA510_16525 [Acidobacteriaceae bacterium]
MMLLVECIGCAVRPAKSVYRLTRLDADYYLLSPDASTSKGEQQTIRIPRYSPEIDSGHASTLDCSIHGPWFSLSKASGSPGYWIADTPSPSALQRAPGALDLKDQWKNFDQALNGLRQRMCFASVDEYSLVRQRIAAGISAPAADTLFYHYGYGPGGYVDLTPGMRLQIEREFFYLDSNAHPSLADYLGTTIVYYQVLNSLESGAKLSFLRTDKRAVRRVAPENNPLDVELATQFAARDHLRLFLEVLAVSGSVQSPAILIGASTGDEINDASIKIENDPGISCEVISRRNVTCARFDGTVTVSPMLQIVANGTITYVPIGSKLWFVLPHTPGSKETNLIRTLRVQRLFQNKFVDVQFARDEESVSQVLLVGGDKVSWSKRAQSKDEREPRNVAAPSAPIGAY